MGAPVRIVDWYRTDPWPRMRHVLVRGPLGLTIGALVIAVSFLTRQSHEVRANAVVLGLLTVAVSAIYTMTAMHRILRDDACLTIRTDGVGVRLASHETLLSWDALSGARWDADGPFLVLERDGAPDVVVPRPFARITGPALAARIQQARRQAAMGLLR